MLKKITPPQQRYQLNSRRSLFILASMTLLVATFFSIGGIMQAQATTSSVAYSDGFEADASAWSGSGSMTRVAGGTNGIPAESGGFYGVAEGSPVTGPRTDLGGASSTWTGDWGASAAVYLDPSWEAGTGFIYSVAVNKPDGTHLRDFMLNAGVLNDESTGEVDQFVALADTAGSPNTDPLYHIKAMPADRRAVITSAGWYTIQHQFHNIDGRLVVTISLTNSAGEVVKAWTIDVLTPGYGMVNDAIPGVVGGNRYGWFTHVTVDGGVAIDTVSRSVSTNQYNVTQDATQPVVLSLADDETFTIAGATGGTVTTPVDITVSGATNTKIMIPADTVITAEDITWGGTLDAPTVLSMSSATVAGKSVTVHVAVKVGTDTPLTFSQSVKVVLQNQAGKLAGYVDSEDTLHPIAAQCAADPAATLVGDINECYTTDGEDLVIWTNHFSTFVAYSSEQGAGVGAPNTGLASRNIALAFAAIAASMGLVITTIALIRRHPHAATNRRKK